MIHLFCYFCFYTRDVIQVWKPSCDFCRLSCARSSELAQNCIWPLSLLSLTAFSSFPTVNSPGQLPRRSLHQQPECRPSSPAYAFHPLPLSSSFLPPFLLFLLAAQSEKKARKSSWKSSSAEGRILYPETILAHGFSLPRLLYSKYSFITNLKRTLTNFSFFASVNFSFDYYVLPK